MGRTENGFDFLGYHFSPEGPSLAHRTEEKFFASATRLYEQEPGEPYDSSRLGLYVRRWVKCTGCSACENIGLDVKLPAQSCKTDQSGTQ